MAGLLDRIKALPSNPIAMASLGLLSMPTRSRYPINPLEYAMNGMQMGIQNQQAQQAMEADKQAQLMREQEYKLRVAQYQQEQLDMHMKRAQENALRERQEQYIAGQSPENQALARVIGVDNFAKEQYKAQMDKPKQTSLMQNYEAAKAQGYAGSIIDYQVMMANARKPVTNVNVGGQTIRSTDAGLVAISPDDKGGWNTQVIVPKKPTEGEAAAGNYANRMQEAEIIARKLEKTPNFDPTNLQMNAATRVPMVGNYALTPEFRVYQQAKEDWVRAKLRKESGAVIAKEEMQKEFETYFPMPGDDKKTIEQKRRAREVAIQGMSNQAGTSAPKKKDLPKDEFEDMPNPAEMRGAVIEDENGTRYTSNGKEWIKQ